jgi:hypothetical protein
MLVFWPHSVFGQNHLSVKMLLNRDSTIHSLQVRRNSSSLSAVRTIKPSRPNAHLSSVSSFRTTCHPVWTLDRPASSVQTKCSFRPDPILYREVSVPACIRPGVSAACLDASQYSISFWFLSKFQEREDQSTVRMRASVRQESQFKYDRPDVWQLRSRRACIKEGKCRFDFNHPDDCLSWYGCAHYWYGNCVLKNSRPDAHPPWSGHSRAL